MTTRRGNLYPGPATIVQGDGRFKIHCSIAREQEFVSVGRGQELPAPGSWYGAFGLLESGFMLDGGNAEIELDDGRKGLIIVTNVSQSPEGGNGRFTGTGDPPA